ncbi:NAD(P)H-binding protein [Williamsia maris]|uniref:NAD(P)H dehydrogenase (Quinone) n=1 Tax=Williamsia maris TaxID=72806 RepID=A0ABT1HAA9_9NOCA|nr:NAD(P)H-binding protein [Williamsia maris]MCP2175195.1 NAD(P)H dehydrogenase (quinone) [Williamsia maris]
MTIYGVTGATGQLGRLAVDDLIERGTPAGDIVAIVRDEAKASGLADHGVVVRVADYADTAALTTAFAGVDRLLFISGSEVGSRVAQHSSVVDAAVAAQVGLVAYTSILEADTSGLSLAAEHVATEKALADSGLPHILLRNGWYSENYAASLQPTIDGGVLYGAAGEGRVAPATRPDFAGAAVAALLAGRPGVFELVGTEHLTYADIAAVIADIAGTPVRYQDLSTDDYAAALTQAGVPEPMPAVLADSDAGIARGELDSTSTDLADLLGRPSTPFADVIRAALA